MKLLDIILLIPLLFGAWSGFRKGLLLEIIGILAFVLGIVGGFKLMEWGMTCLRHYFEGLDHLLPFISFIIIFLAILLLVNMAGKALKKLLDVTLLGGADKFAGAVVGLAKWAIGLSLLLWLTHHFGLQLPGQNEELVLYPYLTRLAPGLIQSMSVVMPFAEGMIESIKQLISPI